MAQIHINPIADRVGQQLYNKLRDRMNPQGVPQNPTYDLIVTLRQSGAQSLINPTRRRRASISPFMPTTICTGATPRASPSSTANRATPPPMTC